MQESITMASSYSKITVEQQFQVRLVELSSEYLSLEELQVALVEMTHQLFIKENIIRELVREKLFNEFAISD
jgi:Phycobilisome degradation protein nblA